MLMSKHTGEVTMSRLDSYLKPCMRKLLSGSILTSFWYGHTRSCPGRHRRWPVRRYPLQLQELLVRASVVRPGYVPHVPVGCGRTLPPKVSTCDPGIHGDATTHGCHAIGIPCPSPTAHVRWHQACLQPFGPDPSEGVLGHHTSCYPIAEPICSAMTGPTRRSVDRLQPTSTQCRDAGHQPHVGSCRRHVDVHLADDPTIARIQLPGLLRYS